MIQLIPVENIPIVKTENELWESILTEVPKIVEDGDVLVCAHTPWSRTRGPLYKLSDVKPSEKALEMAKIVDKPPEKIQVILNESKKIIKTVRNVIIAENKAGIVCANAGVDESNAGLGYAIGIPNDPDTLANEIRKKIVEKSGKQIAVIISDTVGRALRVGAVNIAIGIAGINPIESEVGKKDLFGYEMRVSEIAIADEIASAAELVQGENKQGLPLVIVRGFKYEIVENVTAKILNRDEQFRLFR